MTEAVNDLDHYISSILVALELEKDEETKRGRTASMAKISTLEKQGLALRGLVIASCKIAPYGLVLIEFKKSHDPSSWKTHTIGIGDNVGVTSDTDSTIYGNVESLTDKTITVAFEEIDNFASLGSSIYYMVKFPNNVTYERMVGVMERLSDFPEFTGMLTEIIFGNGELEQRPIPPILLSANKNLTFRNQNLNPSQKSAVEFALEQKFLAIIHGPPGTGKTTTLLELIFQLTKSGEKLLICAPSNVAVDNIMSKMKTFKLNIVRLGHPTRVSEDNQKFTVDAYLNSGFSAQALKDARVELKRTVEKLMASTERNDNKHYRKLIKQLRAEIIKREKKLNKEILLNIDCCFATLGSSHRENLLRYFHQDFFTSVIIDECSQGLDPACWMAMQHAQRCILAGDHFQLAPVIFSQEARELGLDLTLMERCIKKFGPDCYRMLTHQYRMNGNIMDWVSKEIYENQLTADKTVVNHLLTDLDGVLETEETESSLLLLDTSGCNHLEQRYHSSYGNPGEVDLVLYIANELVKAGVLQQHICVITPYNRQVDLLRENLFNRDMPGIEVQTVDGFQGREMEVVLLSLVRSNLEGQVGFLSDRRRLNVAVSRARRLLCVVGDVTTVSKDPTIDSLVQYIKQHGVRRSAHELSNEVTSKPLPITENAPALIKKSKKKKKKKLKNTTDFESSEEAKNKIDPHLKDMLHQFLTSDETEFKFPKDVNAFQRMCIHEEAEKLGLVHLSIGEESERQIVVTMQEVSEEKLCILEEISENSSFDKDNDGAGTLRVKRQIKKKKKPVLVTATNQESDLSCEMLDKLVKETNTCASKKCKVSVRLVGHNCPHCKNRFCFSHTLPEIHGCQDNAKKAARKEFLNPTPKPLDQEQKKKLQKSLHSKLASKSALRKSANKT